VVKRGWHDENGSGANTKIKATNKLLDELTDGLQLDERCVTRSPEAEVIVLRGTKSRKRAPQSEYSDTETTNAMRANLRRINAWIEEHAIQLAISELELIALQDRMNRKSDAPVEFTRRSLCRIFNNGRFDHGGRFYGGWWQEIPSGYRRQITINGEPTIEADYSGYHARLLYASKGLDYLGDPYDVGLDPGHRELVKTGFNALVNASGRIDTPPDYDADEVGLTHKQLLDQISSHHAPIGEYFRSGVGVELQFIDSCIAERVMLILADQGILCLPIHDSFLVQARHQERLISAMYSAYREVVGRELRGDDPDKLIKIIS
jgi:hypothetical protein